MVDHAQVFARVNFLSLWSYHGWLSGVRFGYTVVDDVGAVGAGLVVLQQLRVWGYGYRVAYRPAGTQPEVNDIELALHGMVGRQHEI